MQTMVFHSFMSSMLYNLSAIQRSFVEDDKFPADSVLSKSLEALAGQVDNLRMALVDGYEKKKHI